MGSILMLVGAIIALIYGIILLIEAFKTSVLWGLGYIFVPFVSLIFVIVHFQKVKKPFLMNVLGAVLMVIGMLMMPEVATA